MVPPFAALLALQAHGGKAHASKALQQAGDHDEAAAAASGGNDSFSGGSSDGGSSDGSVGADASGSGSEGDRSLLSDGQLRQAHVSKEEAWRREFVDPYQQIVSEVLDSMLLVRPGRWGDGQWAGLVALNLTLLDIDLAAGTGIH